MNSCVSVILNWIHGVKKYFVTISNATDDFDVEMKEQPNIIESHILQIQTKISLWWGV